MTLHNYLLFVSASSRRAGTRPDMAYMLPMRRPRRRAVCSPRWLQLGSLRTFDGRVGPLGPAGQLINRLYGRQMVGRGISFISASHDPEVARGKSSFPAARRRPQWTDHPVAGVLSDVLNPRLLCSSWHSCRSFVDAHGPHPTLQILLLG